MKNKKNYIILIVVVVLVLYFSLKDNFPQIMTELTKINLFFLLIAILFMIIYGLLRTLSLFLITRDLAIDYSFKKLAISMMIAQFFNATTPFSTGGQPAQVYFFKKEGIKTAVATSIVVENFIIHQIILILYGVIGIILNKIFNFFPDSHFLKQLVTFGFILNVIVMIALFWISFNKKGNKYITTKIISLLAKLKIIKDKEKTIAKIHLKLEEFHYGSINMKKNIKTTIKCLIITFIAFLFLYSIPLIILFSTNNFDQFNILICLSATSYTMLVGALIPIPGGSGGIEYGFVEFFGCFTKGALLSTILLLWRFITYFITIPLGAIALATYKKGE